jgi:hypothetical protein
MHEARRAVEASKKAAGLDMENGTSSKMLMNCLKNRVEFAERVFIFQYAAAISLLQCQAIAAILGILAVRGLFSCEWASGNFSLNYLKH